MQFSFFGKIKTCNELVTGFLPFNLLKGCYLPSHLYKDNYCPKLCKHFYLIENFMLSTSANAFSPLQVDGLFSMIFNITYLYDYVAKYFL